MKRSGLGAAFFGLLAMGMVAGCGGEDQPAPMADGGLDSSTADAAMGDAEADGAADAAADGAVDSGTTAMPDAGSDAATGCQSDMDCLDTNACNGVETCNTATGDCVPGTAPTCDDGNPCNGMETCDPASGCVSGTAPTCDDGNPCNGTETCDPASGCVSGTAPTCDDMNPCTADSCAPSMGCIHGSVMDGTGCGTGMVCMGGTCTMTTCGDGIVQMGEQCDDGNTVDDDVCSNACLLNNPPDGMPISAMDGQWTYVPIAGAVCRDGSDTGIMVNLSSSSDKVMIYLEGGGACFNTLSCGANASSFDPTGFGKSAGVFDRTNMANPVADWNFVYVPYCTGDVHAGNTDSMVAGGLQHFRGYQNITLALERVVPTFPDATQVLLTGVSAGGFGAAANFEQVQRAFWDVPVVLLDDSGPPMSSTYIAPCLQDEWRTAWGLDATILRDCGADCPDPSDYVLDLAGHVIKRYPHNIGGLFSNTQDGTISLFYGFGSNNCGFFPQPLSGAEFEAGLNEFRTYVTMRTDNFGTYYIDGTSHTCIGGGCFYSTTAPDTMTMADVALTDWVAALLAGSASQVGP